MDSENKTFSDLFSSSNTKDSGDKSASFDDILKSGLSSENDNEENSLEKNNNNLNFDDIENGVEKEDDVSNVIENDKSNDAVSSGDSFSFFNNDDVDSKENSDTDTKVEESVSDAVEDNKTGEGNEESLGVNFSFFNNDNVDSKENNNVDTKEEKSVSDGLDDNKTDEGNDESFDVNFSFFDNVEDKSVEPSTSEDRNIDSSNPFFSNNEGQLNSNVDLSSNNDSQSAGDEMAEKNKTNDEEKSNSLKTESSVKAEKVAVEKKASESPFFADDSTKNGVGATENPLFLSKLNLVENENQDKKVDSFDPDASKHFNVKIVKKKEPLIKIIIGVISYAIFIWLLFIGITLLVYVLDIKIRAQKGDYSAPTYNAYVVLTGSMLPEIQVYDVVVTKKTAMTDLKEGDVITFSSADTRFLGTIITHRIIKKNYDAKTKTYSFQTKGDNNNVADSALVPQSNIYGRVILKIPKLGYLQEFLASDGGWIIVILIPCLAVISYDIVKIIKGLKRRKYKNIKVQK